MKKVQAFMIQAGNIIHTKFRFATLNFIQTQAEDSLFNGDK